MERELLITALGEMGYPLVSPVPAAMKGSQVADILDDLVCSDDPRFTEGFPVVLANCAFTKIEVDFSAMINRCSDRRKIRKRLEKMVLISNDLLQQENFQRPVGIDRLCNDLRQKYGDLLRKETIHLDNRLTLSKERLENALKRYAAGLKIKDARRKMRRRQFVSFQTKFDMGLLFSPKQKDLIQKKLDGEVMTKTEKEYFSRVVKKKLKAIANPEVRKIAAAITSNQSYAEPTEPKTLI